MRIENLSITEIKLRKASDDLSHVVRFLGALNPENRSIREISRYLNKNPGKILRPALLFLLCHEYKIKITNDIRKAALVIEIMHNATLLQDDVFDNEKTRRRKPSANVIFGDTRTILAGDYLLVKAMDILQGVKSSGIKKILFDAAYAVCSGEMDNCDLDDPKEITLKKYMSVIEQKTAALFQACGEIVHIHVAKQKPEIIAFTRNFGLLYQIMDDLCDAETLLKGKRRDYTLKDIACLPAVYLIVTNRRSLFEKDGRIASKRVLREMKKGDAYARSLQYMRRRFGGCMKTLRKENDLLYVILESFYSSIEEFLQTRCKG
ncbi:polyprenyl synthetase family protein [Candidatus Sumerlaeota bacterium]|nr:polyprenyl synthetase family protein [Candidatus Sumerlaeota bacterium]